MFKQSSARQTKQKSLTVKSKTTKPKTTSIRSKSTKQTKRSTNVIKQQRRKFSGCASSTCCGGGCGGGGDDNDDDNNNQATATKKTVCDPYGLDGKPLDMDVVNLQLEFTLENRWKYDTTTNILSRTFTFSKSSLPPLVAHVPGQIAGPCHGQGAAFTFLQAVNNISANTNHWPYHIEVVPRKPQVIVGLKTVGRAGITYADIGLATKIDTFFDTNMVPPASRQLIQPFASI